MILQEDYKPLEDKFSETWPENVSWMHLAAEIYLLFDRLQTTSTHNSIRKRNWIQTG